MTGPREYTIKGCRLVGGGACPEQYNAYVGDEHIGYIRLRHGVLYAEHIPSSETVLDAFPRGDGEFFDDEREKWLTLAVGALVYRHQGGDETETMERAELARLKAKYEGV